MTNWSMEKHAMMHMQILHDLFTEQYLAFKHLRICKSRLLQLHACSLLLTIINFLLGFGLSIIIIV